MVFRTSTTIKEDIQDLIVWLASFGQTDNGGVTRLLYSEAWEKAQRALEKKMAEMGFAARFDDVGNLFGRLEGTEQRDQVILSGSHIDTVIDGGKYDGAFGVVSAMIAASRLFRQYGPPKRTLEVVSLCEEEGSRFPLSFWGSGSIAGKYRLSDAEGPADASGISLAEAMHQAGFGKGIYPPPPRNDVFCFLETHIEQGQTLEREGLSWAAVSYIVGQRRFTIRLSGESNHAGTTPMDRRRDAVYAASQMIAQVIGSAKQQRNGLVATVGHIEADPNVANVISGQCRFSLDVRHHEEDLLDQFCQKIFSEFGDIAEKEQVALSIDQWMDVSPVQMNPRLTELNMQLAEKFGISYKKMVSGAGHDSQIFGAFCPTALMFVPSHQGISHSPSEYTKPEDLETGVQMLMKILYRLAYEEEQF
ncbi:allantoate deiminase [Sporolactobacillus putidus]|uniref:Allantoate amidohydrolase n=1 Tax=Sporolactobacillus putidus TaxID=492735 RepID=A0A917W3H2_9BACL|nr:allantoate deiminase [Sporolactobacillus putidus]GGL59538.1 allantoate amidohydrolase [Sporolactobacillus putidus]